MLKLYENIKFYRKKNGMTQEDLAKRAGYTDRSSIAKIERGVVDLPQSKISQFAEIFGVSSGDLMGWEFDKEPEALADITAKILKDSTVLRFAERFMELKDSERELVMNLMDALKKED